MDDFREEKKSFGFNGKILLKNSIFEENILKMFITDTLAKTSQNILAYSFVSEYSQQFFFLEKAYIFKRRGVKPLLPRGRVR